VDVAGQQQQATTVVVTSPTLVVGGTGSQGFGYQPVRTNCPHCHADVVTIIDHRIGGLAWLICGIIVLVGLFFWYAMRASSHYLQLCNWPVYII